MHFHVMLAVADPGKEIRYQAAAAWAKIACSGDWLVPLSGQNGEGSNPPDIAALRDMVSAQHRRKKTWQNIRKKDGAVRYAAKYASKLRQKTIPGNFSLGGRWWGNSYNPDNSDNRAYSATEGQVRELAALLGRDMSRYKVLPRLIFVHTDL